MYSVHEGATRQSFKMTDWLHELVSLRDAGKDQALIISIDLRDCLASNYLCTVRAVMLFWFRHESFFFLNYGLT